VTEVKPMATPRSARATRSVATFGDAGARMDPKTKRAAPQISVARRPMRSAMMPPRKAPDMAPTRTMLTTASSMRVERAKVERTKMSAAAMMPMSKP